MFYLLQIHPPSPPGGKPGGLYHITNKFTKVGRFVLLVCFGPSLCAVEQNRCTYSVRHIKSMSGAGVGVR